MYDLIKEAVHSDEAAIEISKMKKDVGSVVDAISELSLDDTMKLGMSFKRFPLGCDLTEVVVGTCASDLELMDLLGNCRLSDMIGAPIHICAYAFSDIGEKFGMTGFEVMKKVHEIVDVPLDLDHFGENGAMRLPKNITGCGGECYSKGPSFTECPRGRIHERLIDKEFEQKEDKENWVKLSSSVAVNVSSEQTGDAHAAPLSEAKDIAVLAKKYGKGLESIMFVGDGYDEVITGFEKSIDLGADVIVVEGGPFNRCENTTESFAKTIAAARILSPGKVVATNGAYEHELRMGLRSGLNMVITGFPKNHHGYMCGYEPGTARRGKFGLPRVVQIINEEFPNMGLPVQKQDLIAIAAAVKFAGSENIYPNKIGSYHVGDAHWATLVNSRMYHNIKLKHTLNDIVNLVEGSTVSLHGGRFVSWVIAKELDKKVEEIIISDVDDWVLSNTVNNLQDELNATIIAENDDKRASSQANFSIASSTMISIKENILKKVPHALTIV
ncbi:5,10-methenyltetrahydromethanopterin hydrogenase cofactor biosynthesis protein HmdC [Methanobrevibacter gottschalkii]|uniref:5,10-methenyltetrahydromethanopterin hydrogenase cofactor biosynthesis protein HmdC n=2 Tax=Methanobrevibacter gottschalkii TaxID=190974 RepID=A0A3N5B6T7_9EURY|nr:MULTISPECIES: 5,10-methenyltetrahydromethanopterin hydrogenase cofactor biosynthesis protein HmdC [Methanobrevibacter]MCQ2970301.1 5,10-methenyltetrahydromethanopterin hydrogenase cofactor biosynthesis protein HmdC [archaeon]OEC95374.1 5,10-methenyltetrahydromethanopterin hydrogenase cofactor biosynthesis protein HmdC [Methanobrevibacter sp. A27]RPF53144.1 5,10-methenyltetrahydromethanopterin hydrogenase cofactor biosynthesis protein HmdC [Methanobrevibacter gottschalkii DSM 11977]SEK62525.1